MVKVKAIKCVQCGGNLLFENGLKVSICGYCQTPNATIGGDGDRRQVSYFPVVNGGGKTQIPLLLQLAKFIEDETVFWASPSEFNGNEDEALKIDDKGYATRTWGIDAATGKFSICEVLVQTENKRVPVERAGGWFKKTEYKTVDVVIGKKINVLAGLYVFPVFDEPGDNGVLVGHRVEIYVRNQRWIDDVNVISEMINKNFGVVPEVQLSYI